LVRVTYRLAFQEMDFVVSWLGFNRRGVGDLGRKNVRV